MTSSSYRSYDDASGPVAQLVERRFEAPCEEVRHLPGPSSLLRLIRSGRQSLKLEMRGSSPPRVIMLSWQIGIASAPKAAVAGNGGKVQLLQTAPAHVSLMERHPLGKRGVAGRPAYRFKPCRERMPCWLNWYSTRLEPGHPETVCRFKSCARRNFFEDFSKKCLQSS